MTTLDLGLATLRSAAGHVSAAWDWWGRLVRSVMPTGLYARSLLIIVTPMVILQSVVAFVFMERHWNTVTRRLSAAVTQDIAALIDINKSYPQDTDHVILRRIAQERLGLGVDFLPDHIVAVKITRPGEDISDYLTYTTDHNGHLYAELPTAVTGMLCIAVTDNRPDPDGECGRLWSNTCTFSVGVS